MSTILQQMSGHLGFNVDSSNLPGGRFTVLDPNPESAQTAVALLNELLAKAGRTVEVETDEASGGKMTLHVVDAPKRAPPKLQTADITFENAPLPVVLTDLATQSGFKIDNRVATMDARITIHEVLQKEPAGTNVGKLVARLNELLEPQGCIIEETSDEVNGTHVPELAVLSLQTAKRALLPPPVGFVEPPMTGKDWVGIDMKPTIRFNFDNTQVVTILVNMSQRFGFVIVASSAIPATRVTIQPGQAVDADAVESLKLLNNILVPQGYKCVAIPLPGAKLTMLQVMTTAEARAYWGGPSTTNPDR